MTSNRLSALVLLLCASGCFHFREEAERDAKLQRELGAFPLPLEQTRAAVAKALVPTQGFRSADGGIGERCTADTCGWLGC